MKIVHIITRLIIGGAQENTLLSCQGQHALGHEVTLMTGPPIGPEGSLMDRAVAGGYRVEVIDEMRRAIDPRQDFLTYRKLVRRLNDIRPDVVHTHSSKAGVIGRWAAHAARVPRIVHTIHGLAFTASTRWWVNHVYKVLERGAAPITDKIVCVADAMRDQSLAAGVGVREQYVTVYSGMETAPFLNPPVAREVVRKELGIREEDVVVGTIARLFELKGHEDLIDIAPQLCAEFANLRFLWVGDGLLRGKFEEDIRKRGLTDRFILAGLVPPSRIPELANAMDIVAHPSRREGLARALPQGALCGCACVTYDIDGAKEAVIDGVTGFVVKPFDMRAFGEAIAKLVGDPKMAHAMGLKGRELALGRFDARVMVAGLEKVYAGISGPSEYLRTRPGC